MLQGMRIFFAQQGSFKDILYHFMKDSKTLYLRLHITLWWHTVVQGVLAKRGFFHPSSLQLFRTSSGPPEQASERTDQTDYLFDQKKAISIALRRCICVHACIYILIYK